MPKILLFTLWVLSLSTIDSEGQTNLIPNPSFEQNIRMPNGTSDMAACLFWYNPSYPYDVATPDYFHKEAKNGSVKLPTVSWTPKTIIEPNSGQAVAGLFVGNIREYLAVRLLSPLEVGKTYKFTFNYTYGKGMPVSKEPVRLGIYMTKDSLTQNSTSWKNFLNAAPALVETSEPLFSSDWAEVELEFTADQPYQFLCFGNFRPINERYNKLNVNATFSDAYVFFDDFSLAEIATEWSPTVVILPNVDPQDTLPLQQATPLSEVEKRETIHKYEFQTKTSKLKISVFDDKIVDGDIISLYYDGVCILENYTLVKKAKIIELDIAQDKTHSLVLFAHNLGRVPPNTVTLEFQIEQKKHKISLNSTLHESEAIIFRY